MGRKSHTKDRDLTEVQKLKHDNQKLKREVSRLRKMVTRHEDYLEEVSEEVPDLKPSVKDSDAAVKQWKCFACGDGVLVIWIFNRPDGKFYKRKCDTCKHSTKLKPYTDEVKGITNEELGKHSD